jgi:two-component system phosphate regulon sensor histidine kinase PhoR
LDIFIDRSMKFLKNQITYFVIIVALASLAGLAAAQLFVLQETMRGNQLLFEQKISLIKQTLTEEFRKDNALVDELETAVSSQCRQPGSMDSFNRQFKKLTDSVFNAYAVPVQYQYGIYSHGNGETFIREWSNIEDPRFTFDACQNYAQANLTCGNGYSSGYHLALFFPNVRSYLIDQSSRSIRISFLFIAIVLIGFIYAVITIRNQKKLSELKNDFINNLTHEFKTPVFSIGVALKTIRKTEAFNDSHKIRKYVEVIENENERLKNQVDKILQLALVQSGNFLLEKRPFDIHEALERIVRNFRLAIEERGASAEFDLLASKTIIQADETHLSNVFYNLLDNALKYTEGIPKIRISTFDHSTQEVAICIEDNGVGISKDTERFIFDKFYQHHSRPGVNGFGLGLHYVRSVVEAHGGRITVRSEVAKGSSFYIYLPARE